MCVCCLFIHIYILYVIYINSIDVGGKESKSEFISEVKIYKNRYFSLAIHSHVEYSWGEVKGCCLGTWYRV